jgi:predicted O-linked N-acetylglucosamine transferase (SPINDLY family)
MNAAEPAPTPPGFPRPRATLSERVSRALRDPRNERLERVLSKLSEAPAEIAAAKALRGELLRRQGEYQAAAALLGEAITADPSLLAAYHCAALAMAKAERPERARELWSDLLAREPDDAVARYQIGVSWHEAGNYEEAARWYAEHVARHPQSAAGWYNLGLVRLESGDAQGAIDAFAETTRIDSGHVRAWIALGTARHRLGDEREALDAWERAMALSPGDASLRWQAGAVLSSLGQHADALRVFREALALDPADHRGHSALLFELSYDAGLASREEIAKAHRQWASRHCIGLGGSSIPARSRSRSNGQLRIGYLSPRFGDGPLANLFLPVLRAHDRRRFHITLYSAFPHRDAVSAQMQASCERWRDLPDDDDAAAALVRADELDLLIDLAGHAPGHRLRLLARRPAPVQATWLDYFETTGVAAIDYLLSDSVHTPPGDAPLFSERLVLLPHCRFAYAPRIEPVRSPPPSLRKGCVTFGSFNRHAKITAAMLTLWTRILDAVPSSRLVLRASAYRGSGTVRWLRERWSAAGVPVERIDFEPYLPLEQAIAAHAGVDIALDTSPYNGGVTTCDALSMGIPVVTLRGDRMIARQSAALLAAADRPEWVAATPEEYVATAVGLAQSASLGQLRDELQAGFGRTALCHIPGFAAGLERAYERMIETGPRADARSALAPIAVEA